VLPLSSTWRRRGIRIPFFFNQLRLSDPDSMATAAAAADGVVHGNLAASLTLLILVIVSMIVVLAVILSPARRSTHHADARTLL